MSAPMKYKDVAARASLAVFSESRRMPRRKVALAHALESLHAAEDALTAERWQGAIRHAARALFFTVQWVVTLDAEVATAKTTEPGRAVQLVTVAGGRRLHKHHRS